MKKPLIALVLSGGVGKRFWPIQSNKLLFPFLHKPFFHYSVLEVLPKQIDSVVVVANIKNKETVSSFQYPKPVTTVIQQNPLGMADAILSAAHEIQNSRLLIIIADDLYDKQLLSDVIIKAQTNENIFGVISAYKPNNYFPGGYLVMNGDQIQEVIEKPNEHELPSKYVNISGYYIDNSDILLSELSKTTSKTDDVFEKTLSSLMKKHLFVAHQYEGPFASLKYPWNILDIQREIFIKYLKKQVHSHVSIAQTANIIGDVCIEEGVKILDHATIVGPTYIGSHSVIGNNTLIRESHIGSKCVIGFGCDIARSYIGDSCWFHNNYIGDSVIEENVSFGYGTGTANFRLDEQDIQSEVSLQKQSTRRNKLGVIMGKDIRVGIQTGFMPGVKIGSQCAIGPMLTIAQDIPEGMYVEGKSDLIMKKNTVLIKKRDIFHTT
jgi:UDP-N-acetylglucosamine diphosphorylase / glucose-1-phosphate thymidylyltransferase / UDP-N-acetylgalactosamine diphosphorylase / glucosamine-1-phosphate N-acetyltransferase / galactosamine-1-phosphate N-acetyltransferase